MCIIFLSDNVDASPVSILAFSYYTNLQMQLYPLKCAPDVKALI